MLVLTRKMGETLKIGNGISVTLLSVNGKYAKLGINAPKEVSIHREEIYAKIQQTKQKIAV